jgi:two-component system sensor histidine kinase RstB
MSQSAVRHRSPWAVRVALVLVGSLGCWWLVGFALTSIYDEGRSQTDDQYFALMRGPAVLIEAELQRTPRTQWPAVLARMKQDFDYDVSVKPIDSVKFMPAERLRVLHGDIARGDEDQVDTVHYRIAGTDQVIAMGPIWATPVKSDYLNFMSVRLLGTLTLLVLLAFPLLAVWVWLAPVRRDVRALDASLADLAGGEPAGRLAPVESRLMAPLAAGVARMAACWRALVDSQRELSRAVSHELRTPVARLRFGLALLDEQARLGNERVLDSMEQSLTDLEDLVECSLTYARYTQARPLLDLHERELLAWVRDELAPLASTAQARGGPSLRVGVSPDEDEAPLEVMFDPSHMKFALRNLVANALRFAASTVQVTVSRQRRVGEMLACIDVDDDGQGVSEADRARIFEPFVRGRQPAGGTGEGHGLGLSIASRIVEWHGGCIELTHSPLGGARFRTCWPLGPRVHDGVAAPQADKN